MTTNAHLAHTLQSTSAKRPPAAPETDTVTDTPIYARSDTMLGVCHGLGEELGIHANWLRTALALGLFWSPTAMVIAYLTLGVLLAAFRWAFPLRTAATAAAPTAQPLRGDNDDAAPVLSKAA